MCWLNMSTAIAFTCIFITLYLLLGHDGCWIPVNFIQYHHILHSPHFWHSPHSSALCCVHTVNNHHQHQNMLNISAHYSVIISCYNVACKFHRYDFRCIEVFTSRLDYLVSVIPTIFYCLLSNFTS